MSSEVREMPATAATRDRQWFIVSRWQEYEGEARANLLRIIGIGSFYIIELLNHGAYLGGLPAADDQFHKAVTALAVAWTMVALATHLCLRQKVFPPVVKYATTACDLVFLTAILMIADGPKSPLVVGYFLIICLAGLRLNLRLVWFATAGAVSGYVFLLGYIKFFAPAARADAMTVPRYYQLIVLLALALAGVVLGQVIRRVRAMAEDFARRVESEKSFT